MFLFNKLTALLPVSLQPYAKAVYPAITTVVGTVVLWVQQGEFNRNALITAVAGAVYTLITYSVPNRVVVR